MPAPVPDIRALGVEVARLRSQHGWSIDRLAEASGISRRAVIQIEAGRVSAKIGTLHGVAHALGTPLTELVESVCARHPKSVHTPTRLV